MRYVLGIDLGTSAVKALLMNEKGELVDESVRSYSLIHEKVGYSEQHPQDWISSVREAIEEITARFQEDVSNIVGLSYSGQMHGLVLLGDGNEVLRPAILWNDTRTTEQCAQITETVGLENILRITKNRVLEGFTLPKILWVQQHEPEIYRKVKKFLLPKDYLRFAMTGELHMDYSDAAGTLLLDIEKGDWSKEIIAKLGIDPEICPELVPSTYKVGMLTESFASACGLSPATKVYAGGADNACGALGSGVISKGKTMVSIGTSGVMLTFEESKTEDYHGKVHYFNHAITDSYYTMGVTLSAGHSLSWFNDTFAKEESYDELLSEINDIPPGSNGLLFTPYIAGERTPYADSNIRGSFIGIDAIHTKKHFAKAVMEGIVFSLRDTLEIFKSSGKVIEELISIGGGAKNQHWLQMQADIFNATIYKLKNEQGPGIGACMIAAVGSGIFKDFAMAQEACIQIGEKYEPIPENVKKYDELYNIYTQVYRQTKALNEQLKQYR
ncbi:xylulokinase [Ureibacillus sinduriensis]|uniref:Xylulose kinase n=1 Tax=Ureibacillus sinduriensis BLB-1 = JCM 15800 TaxID=1384057 RepID=A0A0A3HPB8_9BACL|nr:xylulokinase [Ureibacillus sinduriensis]KGR74229.1 xylulose kinase [Ureibacillus sinduriensis BLB-1 = JCM 15800]